MIRQFTHTFRDGAHLKLTLSWKDNTLTPVWVWSKKPTVRELDEYHEWKRGVVKEFSERISTPQFKYEISLD